MTKRHTLGELQLAIMRVLWARGRATSGEVHQALEPERGLAPTTIATMLRKMEDKGVVSHSTEGRRFVYHPQVFERDIHQTMVERLVDQLFGGDPLALVDHLVREGEIEGNALDDLRARIDAAEKRRDQEREGEA